MTVKAGMKRRVFLKKATQSGAGLTLALMMPGCESNGPTPQDNVTTSHVEVNAFVRIGTDNTVTVVIKHLEMGQGTYTGLATLVAEELDADWDQIVAESAPADAKRYYNLHRGKLQSTGGTTSIANAYLQMREAGAAARQMLIAAAGQLWQVNPKDIHVEKGHLFHSKSNRQATFGELAVLASQQAIPSSVTLKDPASFSLIGKKLSRKDVGKTDGSAIFTQDIQLPNMLIAVVAHPPRFGATLVSIDASKTKAMPGIVGVVQLDNAVAVLAQTFWHAKKGRDSLVIHWDEDKAFQKSTGELLSHYHQLAKKPGLPAKQEGDAEAAFKTAHHLVEASYEFPFLAHAAMEPLNCVIQITENGAEIWNGGQYQTLDQNAVATLLGIKPEQVTINTVYAGGSFGRRASVKSDYVLEAAKIAKAFGQSVPIKMVWTREDDMHSGYFRPMYVHRLKAGLDQQGNIVAWQHRIVGQSIVASSYDGFDKNSIDPSSVEGAVNLPYAIPNQSIELHSVDLPVPVGWWRSVAHSHTAFATEAFTDELASVTNQDPIAYRMKMLKKHPKHQQVLQLAAEKAQWHAPLPKGKARGVALHKSFGTTVAQIAEVSIHQNRQVHVDKVTCVVDCGLAINPDVIAAQMEGGIGFGLSPAIMSEITFEKGRIAQSNFHDYQVLRMAQMPEVDVHIIPSTDPPTGVGETGVPVIAPAVANALYAATSKPKRRLPFGMAV